MLLGVTELLIVPLLADEGLLLFILMLRTEIVEGERMVTYVRMKM